MDSRTVTLCGGAFVLSLGAYVGYQVGIRRGRESAASHHHEQYKAAEGLHELIGGTPLVHIKSLSEETGCKILAKAEFMNPGGSVKDRIALEIVQEAIASGCLKAGGLVSEGTVGSTGISLAIVAASVGVRCFIAMPDDAAIEKSAMLEALGAEVRRVRPVAISHPDHFVNVARRRAASEEGAIFADQFENAANLRCWRWHWRHHRRGVTSAEGA